MAATQQQQQQQEMKGGCEPPAELLKPRSVAKPVQPTGVSDTAGYKGKDRLPGKVVVVTGGASGIGRTMVEVFAKEGAVVHFCDVAAKEAEGRAVEAKVKEAGGRAVFKAVDVADEQRLRCWLNCVGSGEGRIDAVVPNAADFTFGSIDEVADEDWDRVLTTNVKGYAWTAKHSLPWLRKAAPGGSICFIASVSSFIGQRSFIPYNASKGAVLQLMRCLALDLGPEDIRVNALCPGSVLTGATEQAGHHFGKSVDEVVEHDSRKTFLGRIGATLEVALAAVYLISDESSYTTGSCLVVDGGRTSH